MGTLVVIILAFILIVIVTWDNGDGDMGLET